MRIHPHPGSTDGASSRSRREAVFAPRWVTSMVALVVSIALVLTGGVAAFGATATPVPAPTSTELAGVGADGGDVGEAEEGDPVEDSAAGEGNPVNEDGAGIVADEDDQVDATDPPAEAAGDVGVLSVPEPGTTTAVITVKVGGDRRDVTGVDPLAGVVLLLNEGADEASGVRPDGVAGSEAGWARCVSDTQGDCSFTVPETQVGGENRNARYWVVQADVPAGFFPNLNLRTGTAWLQGERRAYQFRTGEVLQAGSVYSSQDADDFMLASGSVPTASGGIWQQSRINPELSPACGLDVALILDLSGSVSGEGLDELKQASDRFVRSLEGTPSRMSLFSFSVASPAAGASRNYPDLTPVSTEEQGDEFSARYADWTATGGTNWDRGLATAAAANTATNHFDLAVVVTDGNPTLYNDPPQGNSTNNRFREIENGIFSANALKDAQGGIEGGTRVLAFGVGAAVLGSANGLNLRAISGTTAFSGGNRDVADYYQTTDYDSVGSALRSLALGNCAGSLTVTKQIVPGDAPEGSIEGASIAGAGWQFDSTVSTAGVTPATASAETTGDGTGTVSFPLDFPGGTSSAAVSVREQQQPGYELQPVDGQNAVCTNLNTGASVPVTGNVVDGFSVDIPSTQAINCTVYNRAPAPPAEVVVTKDWVVNGVAYANGAQPAYLEAQLQITGPDGAGPTDQGWGVPRPGYAIGDTVIVSEEVTLIDDELCTSSAEVTSVNEAATAIPVGDGFELELTLPQTSANITNTVDCRSTLSLRKQVELGDADPTDWTLSAENTSGAAVTGFSGRSGSAEATNIDVTPEAQYQLFENDVDPLYVQTDNRTDFADSPLSTGSATCIRVNADGTPYADSGYSDGINGDVLVPLGNRVACTFTNQTARLRLMKEVVNDDGGTLVPSDFQLTATPAQRQGLTPTTVPGESDLDQAEAFPVRPGQVYTLTETDAAGYEFVTLQQFVGTTWTDVTANPDPDGYPQQNADGDWEVTVDALRTGVYRFVNDDIAPRLTLVKTVVNDDGGTAAASAWTLTAATPDGAALSGSTGTPQVTSVAVDAGTEYTIGETGPVGYDWTALTCTDRPATTVGSPTLTLQPGDDVTCTLVNDDVLVPVVVTKSDGTAAQDADGTWTVSYGIRVDNPSTTLPTSYTLTDTPQYESSFEILSEGWSGTPDLTDVAIEPSGSDTYTYVVRARALVTPVDPAALTCDPTAGGGFFNRASVTFPGGSDDDTGCAVPGSPVVQKTARPAVQDTSTGAWTLTYEVAVSNPTSLALSYTLDDDAGPLPAGVTGGAPVATDPEARGGGTFVRNAAWAGAGQLATGTLPPAAVHTYLVTRVVTVSAATTPAAETCGTVVNEGGGVWNTASVTNGIDDTSSSDCTSIEVPGVTIDKTVTGTSQRVDGLWRTTYDVVVTNTSATTAAVYDLEDTLLFGGDIEIRDATWTGPTGSGSFDAGTAVLATDRVLVPATGGAGVETYTVTVISAIDEAAWNGDTLVCLPGETPDRGGFLNSATVTARGISTEAQDCSEPSEPTIVKTGVSAVQASADATRWVVSYDVTVTSGGSATFYSLSDTPAFAAGIDIVSGSAQRTDIADQPTVAVTAGVDFVSSRALPVGARHVYRVAWTVVVTDAFDEDLDACTGEPGAGFFNGARLTVGDREIDDTACIPVEPRVYPTVTKSATSTSQDEAGQWTVVYDLTVTLAARGAANPGGRSAEYDLTDTLDFGDGITVVGAAWTGPTQGTFADVDDTAVLASRRTIAAGVTDVYTVTVRADVSQEAVDDGSIACRTTDDGGGFLNTGVLRSGGQRTDVEACAEPLFPEVQKTAGAYTRNADGTQTVSYDVTVRYPETDAVPAPAVSYTLTDQPTLPAGVVLVGDWVAESASAATPAPSDPTWSGTGVWTIATSGFTSADVAAGRTVHQYRVTATVDVPAPPQQVPATCDAVEQDGFVIVNSATVISGDVSVVDDACQVVHYDDVGIVKTIEGATGPVESGQEFDYVLTVTNYGTRAAVDVTVEDVVPERLTVTALDLSGAPGWSNDNAPALVGPGNTVNASTDTFAVGQSVVLRLSVTVDPVEVPTIPRLEAGDPVPTPTLPESELVNDACVDAEIDANPDNDCDTVTIETKDIAAVVYTRCVADAPFIGFALLKTENLRDEPVSLDWRPQSTRPDTAPQNVEREYAGGSVSYADEFPWVGTAFTPSGVSIDYPGWRPLEAADYVPGGGYYLPGTTRPMTAEEQQQDIFNGLILDPSELDFSWRGTTTVTLSTNPELSFDVTYPPASPTCFVARDTEVQIDKQASVVSTGPGSAFRYTLAVQNVSDDSAADGVVVTDAIPSTLRITRVSWQGQNDAATFPTWRTCAVTGQNAAGFGGTLRCELFGPLQPRGSGLGRSQAPTITLDATVSTTAGAGIVTNVGVVDYYTFGNPGDPGRDTDDAVVLIGVLAVTGGSAMSWISVLGVLLLAGGVALVIVRRRQRGSLSSD